MSVPICNGLQWAGLKCRTIRRRPGAASGGSSRIPHMLKITRFIQNLSNPRPPPYTATGRTKLHIPCAREGRASAQAPGTGRQAAGRRGRGASAPRLNWGLEARISSGPRDKVTLYLRDAAPGANRCLLPRSKETQGQLLQVATQHQHVVGGPCGTKAMRE